MAAWMLFAAVYGWAALSGIAHLKPTYGADNWLSNQLAFAGDDRLRCQMQSSRIPLKRVSRMR
jgi:hypothetical protein